MTFYTTYPDLQEKVDGIQAELHQLSQLGAAIYDTLDRITGFERMDLSVPNRRAVVQAEALADVVHDIAKRTISAVESFTDDVADKLMHEGAGAGTPTPEMSGLETGRADDTQAVGVTQAPGVFRTAYHAWAAATAAYELAPEDSAEHVVLSARRDVLNEDILALLPQLRTTDEIMDAILFATLGGQCGVDDDHAAHIVAAIKRLRGQEASA